MGPVVSTTTSRLAAVAMLVCACAVFALGAQVQGYVQSLHPVSLPGARGMPGAMLFNAMAFVAPGALLVLVAWRLRAELPAGTTAVARIGAMLVLLSALAFAAQGLLPLDLERLDGGASRWHATAWTAWWIAFAAGASLLAVAARALRFASALAVAMVLWFGLFAGDAVPAGIAQRIAFAAWFGWCCFAAAAWPRTFNRGAA